MYLIIIRMSSEKKRVTEAWKRICGRWENEKNEEEQHAGRDGKAASGGV